MPTSDPSVRLSGSGPGDAAEQAQLDKAMQRADALLVSSLQSEERRRVRRQFFLYSLGGVAMLTVVCVLALSLASQGEPTKAAEKPAAQDRAQAARLSAEGWQLWNAQQYLPAVGKFQQSVELDPKNVNGWNGLGWASFNSGSADEAAKAFEQVLKLEPKHPAALNGLGQLYLTQGKDAEAEKYLLKAAPTSSAAWYGLAKIYLRQGKFAQAEKWAAKAAKAPDADPSAAELLKAAKEKRVPEELAAPAQAGPAVASLPKAWQLMNQGRREEALEIFEAALAKAPQNAAVLNGLGWFYLLGGDTEQAKPYFEKALAADPKGGGAMNGLARVLQAEGDLDGAMKLWQEMVDELPGVNAGTVGLAEAYLQKGEPKKAVPLLEQLVKAEPANRYYKDKLAEARAATK